MDVETKNSIIFGIVAIFVGYGSLILNEPLINLAVAVIVMFVLQFLMQTLLKIKEEKKFWTNAYFVYILTWFIVWTFFYNIHLFKVI